MTTEAENRALVREYFAAWERGDPDAVAAYFAEGFSTTYTAPDGEEVRVAPADVREWIAGWAETFTDTAHEIHELVAEGDQVMAQVTYRGTHDGPVFGVQPTGTRVAVEEFLRFRIADGTIVELDWLGDDLALLRQLGVDLPFGD